MLDLSLSTAGSQGAFGLLAPNPAAPAEGRNAPPRSSPHASDGSNSFEERLDASLAASEDEEATDIAAESSSPSRMAEGDAGAESESVKASSADDEEEEVVVVASEAAAHPVDNLTANTSAPVHIVAALFDLTMPTDFAEQPDTGTEGPEGSAPVESSAGIETHVETPEAHSLSVPTNRATSDMSAPVLAGAHKAVDGPIELVEHTAAAAQAPQAPVDAGATEQSVIDTADPATKAAAQAATDTAENGDRSSAAVTVATETAFDHLADTTPEQSEGERANTHASASPGELAEAQQGIKTSGSTFEHQLSAYDRPTVAGGQAQMAHPRNAEVEGTRSAFELTSFAEAPAADTPERIVQSLRLQFQRGGGDALVHIKPEHLGPLTISLRVENGAVSARVIAENPVVAEWLQANEQTLREGLKSNGLQLDRLVIQRDQDPSSRTPHRETNDPRREQRRRFAEQRQSTFEITV